MKKLQDVKGVSEQKAEKMRAAAMKLDGGQGFRTVGEVTGAARAEAQRVPREPPSFERLSYCTFVPCRRRPSCSGGRR